MKTRVLIALMSAGVAGLASAQTTGPTAAPGTDPDLKKIAQASAPAASISAKEMITKQRDQYLAEKGLQLGPGNPGNSYIAWAAEVVSVPGKDPSWAKARVNAFDRALIKAEANFLSFERSNIISESVREIFSDDSQLNQQFENDRAAEKDKWQILQDKLLALGEAEINEKLKQAGVDASSLEGRKPFEKFTTLKDQINKKAITRAFGSLSGVRTLQTFEGSNDTGGYAVGALVIASPKFAEVATLLASGNVKPHSAKDPRDSIMNQLPKGEDALLNDFGVRVFVDENGDDCVVSFAQWSVGNNTSSERSREMLLDRALETARNSARAAIADFANASLAWSSESTRGELFENYRRKYPQGNLEEVEGADIIDQSRETFKKSSNLTIAGMSEIRTWRAKDPQYGQDIVGVVLMWSPTSQEQAKLLRDKSIPAAGGDQKAKPAVRQGHDFNNVNDF